MQDLHSATRNLATIMIGPASRVACFARGLVFLAIGLAVAGPAMSADSRLSTEQYREVVKDANASYQAEVLRCNTTSPDERAHCRREARAALTEALAAANARRALGTDKSVDPSKPPNPETPSGLKASKTDIAPQLQRDSPPDIVAPK